MIGLGRCVYIYNGILFSHKKNKIMPFAAMWMELETLIILSEVSQKEKDKYHMISRISGIYSTNEPFHRKENHGLGE